MIIRDRLKVAPRDVEEVLISHPGISEAAVVGLEDERLAQIPVAAVVPSRTRERASADELLAFLGERLPA